MNVEIWHVKGTRFHFGKHGLGQERSGVHFPSDSLFSALVARIAITEGAERVKEFTARFEENSPPFLLSSAFPRIGEVLFFPPLLSAGAEVSQSEETVKPKKLKKVAYLSEGVFRELLSGASLSEKWNTYEKFHKDTVLTTEEERRKIAPKEGREKKEKLWTASRQARVTIDRIANNSQIYHTGQVIFDKEDGLWFGMRWLTNDSVLKDLVKNAFADLGYAGLGGERSSGYGICEITPHAEIQLPAPEGKLWVSLSRYIPKEEEMHALAEEKSAYQIESVGGWVRSSYGEKDERRKRVNLLAEGAVLGALESFAPGMMVDAQPSYGGKKPLGHPAWRNGFALGVGLEGGV